MASWWPFWMVLSGMKDPGESIGEKEIKQQTGALHPLGIVVNGKDIGTVERLGHIFLQYDPFLFCLRSNGKFGSGKEFQKIQIK